jgi:hypothetical protein
VIDGAQRNQRFLEPFLLLSTPLATTRSMNRAAPRVNPHGQDARATRGRPVGHVQAHPTDVYQPENWRHLKRPMRGLGARGLGLEAVASSRASVYVGAPCAATPEAVVEVSTTNAPVAFCAPQNLLFHSEFALESGKVREIDVAVCIQVLGSTTRA